MHNERKFSIIFVNYAGLNVKVDKAQNCRLSYEYTGKRLSKILATKLNSMSKEEM